MEKFTLDVPAMYGDHHVVEVRRLLYGLDGVADVYASSSFQFLEITYDDSKVSAGTIETELNSAGYLGDLSLEKETATPANEANGQTMYFRHTAAFEQTQQTVSFGQVVQTEGRALWPCPGMGPLQRMDEE